MDGQTPATPIIPFYLDQTRGGVTQKRVSGRGSFFWSCFPLLVFQRKTKKGKPDIAILGAVGFPQKPRRRPTTALGLKAAAPPHARCALSAARRRCPVRPGRRGEADIFLEWGPSLLTWHLTGGPSRKMIFQVPQVPLAMFVEGRVPFFCRGIERITRKPWGNPPPPMLGPIASEFLEHKDLRS